MEPFCAEARYFTWEVVWNAAELERTLVETLPEYQRYAAADPRKEWAGRAFTPLAGGDPRRLGRLDDLRIAARTTSGRIARLDVVTEAGVFHVRAANADVVEML